MLHTLSFLVAACAFGVWYGRRLDAADRARLGEPEEEEASDPYALCEPLERLTKPWHARVRIGVRVSHPYVNWYCVYSETLTRPARVATCAFEILAFLYGAALQTSLEYPDVDDECAAKGDYRACGELKNLFRFSFALTDNRPGELRPGNLCAWDPCASACFAATPRAELKSSTRLQCARIRMVRHERFRRASRTR